MQGEDRPLKRLPDTVQQTDKLPDGPEPVAVEIEYPSRSELQPVSGDVAEVLDALPGRIVSADWVEACAALGTLRQLAVHADPAVLGSRLETLVPPVIKSVRSLRSTITKVSLPSDAAVLAFSYTGTAHAVTNSSVLQLS